MTIAARTNETASTAKATPVLVTAITTPATGGPTIEVSWYVPWSSAFADGRRSASSVRGRNACCAGMYSASAAPNTAPRTASSGIDTPPVTASAAIAPTVSPRTMCAVSISVRPGRRSATTPNGTRRMARGTAIAISTVPTARPEPVSEMTSHDSATKWNWSPISEIASLVHSSRKSRVPSARRNGSDRTRPAVVAVTRSRSGRRRRRRRRPGWVRGTRSSSPRGRDRPGRSTGRGRGRGRTGRRRAAAGG